MKKKDILERILEAILDQNAMIEKLVKLTSNHNPALEKLQEMRLFDADLQEVKIDDVLLDTHKGINEDY